jgi:CRISPR-associated protein Csb3
MSPRLTRFDDETWEAVQHMRHAVIDELEAQRGWLDLRFIGALGEPCYWSFNSQDSLQQDDATSSLEMQPRNQGSEFVGSRLRKIADSVAARSTSQVLAGLCGLAVHDEAGGDRIDSRTATGLASPGPTDNALAWCALWGISQFPLAMRVWPDRRPNRAVTTGHLRHRRREWFYVPMWRSPWQPAHVRTIIAAEATRLVASDGLPDVAGRPSEVAAARAWLSARGVDGVMRFPVKTFGSDNAPERRAMAGEPIPVVQ